MKYVFVFGRLAVVVRYWEERGDVVEGGARVELRRVEESTAEPHRPGAAGFRVLPLVEGGIWRADLFTVLSRPGNEGCFHHHPHFRDGDVGPRVFDDDMAADPVGWTTRRLADLPALLDAAGAGDVTASVDLDEFATALPAMRAAMQACLGEGVES